MSGFVCGTCGALTNIFGKEGVQTLASRTGVEVIGEIQKSQDHRLVEKVVRDDRPVEQGLVVIRKISEG